MRQSRQVVLQALRADLQQLQRQHAELVLLCEIEKMREQLLVEIIQEQELVDFFKQAMEQQQHGPAAGGSLPQEAGMQFNCDTNSYVISLLSMVHPATVQEVLIWQADDWHHFLVDAASRLCLLLQLTTRNDIASNPPTYESIIEEQLCQVVDEIVTMGALGAIFGEVTGQQLGICTSLNHITMQEEAPQQDHWQQVLQQLQLSQAQLLKLSSAYHEFMRQRKAHRTLQSSLSKAMACNNSCTLQLLAAAQSGSESAPAGPASSGGTAELEGAAQRSASVRLGPASGRDAASMDSSSSTPPTAAAAAATPDGLDDSQPAIPMPCPSQLMTRLLVTVNQSFSMLFLVLHNTLTRKQIARMLVASFPFVPRPAPLMEAASKLLSDAHQSGCQPGP